MLLRPRGRQLAVGHVASPGSQLQEHMRADIADDLGWVGPAGAVRAIKQRLGQVVVGATDQRVQVSEQ